MAASNGQFMSYLDPKQQDLLTAALNSNNPGQNGLAQQLANDPSMMNGQFNFDGVDPSLFFNNNNLAMPNFDANGAMEDSPFLDNVNYDAPNFKTFLLLQAHFSRLHLPSDLALDQSIVLGKVLNLLAACVDVMSSNASLGALGAMDLSQMCVQDVWDSDSPLKQVPHFDNEVRGRRSLDIRY